jgi:hypothetical protein
MISGASRNGPSKTGAGAVRINIEALRDLSRARGAVGFGQRADGLRLVSSAAG